MPRKRAIRSLIIKLQTAIASGSLTGKAVRSATRELSAVGYSYRDDTFPPLSTTRPLKDTSSNSPQSLAEAMLWKLGKWKSYKKFAATYATQDSTPSKTDVVFFAFAKHLRDRQNPIYDQHALRALWAICEDLGKAERKKCRALLFNTWKSVGSGSNSIDCYALFVKHVRRLVSVEHGASMAELDRLLMPLGKALKKATTSYAEFCRLCGWSER
jgi:hypothetical protein